MVHRVEARVRAQRERLGPDDDPHDVAEEIAGQFLPLDAARADETAVWLEFAVAARTDPRWARSPSNCTTVCGPSPAACCTAWVWTTRWRRNTSPLSWTALP